MKKLLHLLLCAPLWIACESSDPAEFGIDPAHVAYNDEAPSLRKTFCNDGKCDDPSYEERYVYSPDGKLSKTEVFVRNASGKMEMQSYTDYFRDAQGQLTRKVQYSPHGAVAGWVSYNESEYEYQNGLLKTEKMYFNRHQPDEKVFTGAVEYVYQNGKKVTQKWLDDRGQYYRRVDYKYRNDVVNLETWYDGKDNVIRIFEHKFFENRRQISEHMLNSTEVLALVEKTYDDKGRLTTEQTKVFNMLLCAMTPGLVRYSY